ncbi:glycosyltransferase family 4 protein [Bacillus sp. RO3]|nr:glycosyltransferase family 4 protein [Bacillus sp. RO3]
MIKLLIAGHDLKFTKEIIDYFNNHPRFELKIDKWSGHEKHDIKKSTQLLQWADIIFCEWGLGNSVWYSQHKLQKQLLIIRMLGQERMSQFTQKILWERVDKVIYVSSHLRKIIESKNKIPSNLGKVIPNVVDTSKFTNKKIDSSIYNIGIIGFVPKLKRLDIALNIFEELWKYDARYKLFIKGKQPMEYNWLWRNKQERKYYEDIFKRIKISPWRNSVFFDGWDNDVPSWLNKIGYILSTSDFESFHLSVSEGMASGAVPVIRNWEGASNIYPTQFIYNNIHEAVALIKNQSSHKNVEQILMHHVKNNFDKNMIVTMIEDIFTKLFLERGLTHE